MDNTSNVLKFIDEKTKVIGQYYKKLGSAGDQLLGYVMALGYENGTVITNDYYKLRCGGIAKNSFLIIRPRNMEEDFEDFVPAPPHLILARVLEPAATPLATDVSRTYFELHKSHMPDIDVFTKSELQWSAMSVAILGTFYDDPVSSSLSFGGDIESFLSPHMYEVFVPTPAMLEILVNAFVKADQAQAIGHLRLTESRLRPNTKQVKVFVTPHDFIGSRTALFGKTRMGKSNTVKVIAQLVLDSGVTVGQLIFDPNGEYAYTNEQDRTSIFEMYRERCLRFTLRPNPEPGVKQMKVNFYKDIRLGHKIMRDLFEQQEGRVPDYMKPFFEWEILSEEEVNGLRRDSYGDWTRYQRQLSIYACLLYEANFQATSSTKVKLHLNAKLRKALGSRIPALAEQDGTVPDVLPIKAAVSCFAAAWKLFIDDSDSPVFGDHDDVGKAYFEATSVSLLTMLTGKRENGTTVSGAKKLASYRQYHAVEADDLLGEILGGLDRGATVIMDLSNAPEDLQRFYSEMICRSVFQHQMDKFTSNRLGQHFVQFYFEEAHNIFPKDDSNLRSIYNRLTKEGAKLNIGVVYSTQSIASLSPDLLKNTENFFIAHLNDQTEIRALERFHEFRDVGADVQKTKEKGFVRMITRSHRFALPVQIRRFGPDHN